MQKYLEKVLLTISSDSGDNAKSISEIGILDFQSSIPDLSNFILDNFDVVAPFLHNINELIISNIDMSMRNMEKFTLGLNKIKHTLDVVNLQSCNLYNSDLSPDLCKILFFKVRNLNLSNNNIDDNLAINVITSVSKYLPYDSILDELYLSDNKGITRLPDFFLIKGGQLFQNLCLLNLSCCGIQFLDFRGIGTNLSSLEELVLNNINNIESIQVVGLDQLPKLYSLLLNDNHLSKLPYFVNNICNRLVHLELNNNLFKQVDIPDAPSLLILEITNNQLEKFPKVNNGYRLSQIDLNNNDIYDIPVDLLDQHPYLIQVSLSGNITSEDDVPEELYNIRTTNVGQLRLKFIFDDSDINSANKY